MQKRPPRIIISGGGTGGHIYPALSIGNALKERDQGMEILFVGAENRMEMEKVPAAGYRIIGLPVIGAYRRQVWKNVKFIIRLMKSLRMATKIIMEFKPDVVVGVGGYASAPVLNRAARLRIPTVIQEQNSYAGVANRWLGKRAISICVAYDGMEKYFPKERIKFTGNPVREDLINLPEKVEAANYFGLEESRRTILVLGGSLGAGTINNGIAVNIDLWMEKDIQMLWQTGKNYYKTVIDQVREGYKGQLKIVDFIDRMDLAYAMADIIISRAGAGTISELCLVGKPCILIPSPNVAGDHQTSNALSLVEKEAALMVRDSEVHEKLAITSIELSRDIEQQKSLKNNISQLARPHAARDIVEEVMKLTNRNN